MGKAEASGFLGPWPQQVHSGESLILFMAHGTLLLGAYVSGLRSAQDSRPRHVLVLQHSQGIMPPIHSPKPSRKRDAKFRPVGLPSVPCHQRT